MAQAAPLICHLTHAGFRMLGEPVFRLSEGTHVPSMVVELEKQNAVLPLRSVAREFGIDMESADGQMLNLIEQALDFVVALRLGDALPTELNGGEASWDPTEQDRALATSRVRHNLVRSVFARMGRSVTLSPTVTAGWEDPPDKRDLVKQAIAGAAGQMGCEDTADVTDRLTAICNEMAYIEAMRRTLAKGMAKPQEKLLRLNANDVPVSRRETVKQVQGLARRGMKQISDRFDDVDARLDDALAMMRDVAAATAWLRRQRDWLFRTNHAWEPVFADWANASSHFDEFLWKVVERTYLFLAPRFMSYQEWTTSDARPKNEKIKSTVW